MTSITKHQYDFTNGKCANKENVSSNGKQSEMTKSSSGIDSNFDWAEKEAISQQRKLRLIQVRQQSKEIAAQVRENVRKEEQRQIENINRIKRDELLNWRQKQMGIVEKNYEKCLEQIGEAHLNAARENAKERQFEEQKEKNRKLACKRGKIAAQKLKEKQTKFTKPTVKQKQVITISKTIQSSPESFTSTSSTSSSESGSDASVVFVDSKQKPETKIKTPTKPTISPKRSASVKMKSPVRTTEYNPSRYASANNSIATDVSFTDSPMSDPPPIITKVSDLLGKKSTFKATSLRSSSHIAKTYKLDKSPVTSRNTARKVTQKPQINTVSARLSRVIKTPTKSSGKSPVKILPERKHFVPEFVKGKPSSFSSSTSLAKPSATTTKSNSSIQMTPQRKSKVQFYDHANKFSRQYDGNIDVIEQVQNVIPLNAWDEAKKDSELDIMKRNELLNMKILAENRSKVALEKEKIRKDYELMSIQLKEILDNNELAHSFLQTNEILSESRLKQLAEEKQQLMNDEFSKVLKQPSIITCPKINSNSSRTNECGEINVAQAKSQTMTKSTASKRSQKKEYVKHLQKDGSESSHSFLLDYINERSNHICDDINRCRNDDKNDKDFNQGKITALHDLLSKVNSFRDILCNEIKQNNGDISHIDAEQFMNEIDKMEETQHDIMNEKTLEKSSSRKQSKQKPNRELELNEREKLLKMKESCIDKKVRELFLREKKIKDQKQHSKKETGKSSAVAILTANGAESMGEVPVRIVINVNKNEQNKEKSTEVIVNDLKWSEKLQKNSSESIQAVPVSNGVGKIYPKTTATKPKVVTLMERKQLDISSSLSTTSYTSYFSPPDHIKTQLTAKMEQSAISSNVNVQMPSESNSPLSDTELLHYIIRMLGMSRASIEQLNMSSVSTVKTPNSSVVNMSNNRLVSSLTSTPNSYSSPTSMELIKSIDRAKFEQLAKYLAENNKLTSKSRKDSKESGASSGVWDEILSKKNEPNSKSEKTENDNSKSKTSQHRREHEVIEDSDEKLSRNDLIAKYDELAANCTKRIIDLDTMISKVREDKQKLLENTLSSASSLITAQKEATEYMDYPQQEQKQQSHHQIGNNNLSSPLSDSKGTNAPSSDFSSTSGTADISMPNENRACLFAARNKLLGESKDSGVGISRPVTSSDYRESPDLRQNPKAMDSEGQSKLLQNALRENSRDATFEPLLKDIPRANYRISTGGQTVFEQQSTEQILSNSRDRMVKPSPPPAMARYSPPHELSTITEIDTPQTSRLNATDATNLNDHSIKLAQDDEISKLIYKAFPQLKDYIKSNPNISQVSMASINDITGTSAIANEQVEKLLEPFGSQVNDLKYKMYEGDRPDTNSRQLDDSELRMSYSKFPTHSEYAKSIAGLLDSQSLDKVNFSNNTSNSSLPDIVNELKSRNILDHSFEETQDNRGDLDDLLLVPGNARPISKMTTESTSSDTLSEELEHELKNMGLAWVSAELKKSKKTHTSTSQSSDSSNRDEKLNRLSNKQLSPIKTKTVQRKPNDNDSFVDKNLVATYSGTVEGTVTTQKSESDQLAKSINLKDFLARQLMKHSSMSSSSSDSSLASIFLKSFLGQADTRSPDTPQNRGTDKHRTSTPVDHSSGGDGKDSTSKKMYRTLTSTAVNDISKNQTETPTFFSNESHQLSSVRMSTTNSMSSTLSGERQK